MRTGNAAQLEQTEHRARNHDHAKHLERPQIVRGWIGSGLHNDSQHDAKDEQQGYQRCAPPPA
jgi:hypothetical protein